MNVKIIPHALRGEIWAIPSKSDAHRLFICAALADEPTDIQLDKTSQDIDVTINCLRAAGAGIVLKDGVYTVHPFWKSRKERPGLDCGESGSTLRFLLPVAAAVWSGAEFSGHGRLPRRPLSPLKEEMEKHGAVFSENTLPFTLDGQLKSGVYTMAGNISSQFISGLLFALPLLTGDSEILLTTPLESESYINITLNALEKFNIKVQKTNTGFLVPGGQKYKSPGKCRVEGDWSNAAFWLCAGALGGAVKVLGLNQASPQGDKAVADILRQAGAHIAFSSAEIAASKGLLKGTVIDAADIPDLVPVLSVVASVAAGETIIKNVGRLRLKESDRVEAIINTLSALGGDIREENGNLYIKGKKGLIGGTVDGYADHRIVMSAAVASIICSEPVIIKGAGAVEKSYPLFFRDFISLGGEVHVV